LFKSSKELRQHLRTHTDKRDFKCEIKSSKHGAT
jgi:hypothetical protein